MSHRIAFLLFLMVAFRLPAAVYQLPHNTWVDWTRTGLSNGIPTDYIVATNNVKSAPYNATGDGTTDDWGAIDSAITNATDQGVVYFPAGTYSISTDILVGPGHASRYNKKIVLRGAGPGVSTIKMNFNSGQGGIYVRGTGAGTRFYLASGYTMGSTTIVSSNSPTGIALGDFIGIGQTYGSNYWVGRREAGEYDYQIAQVTNISGTTIQFDPPLMRLMDSTNNPWVEELGLHTGVGIENMSIQLAPGKTAKRGIYAWRTAYCWFNNVRISDYNDFGVTETFSFHNEARQMFITYTGIKTTSSYGYQYSGPCTYNRIVDSIFSGQPTAILFQHGAWGNAAAFNYVIRGLATASGGFGVAGHGSSVQFNLVEGNFTDEVRWDQVWGANHTNVTFRNYTARIEPTLGPRAFNDNAYGLRANATNYWNVFIDNVVGEATYQTNSALNIGTSPDACCGNDALTISSTLLHGNYYAFANQTVYDSGLGTQTFTNSYIYTSKPSWFSNVAWPPIGADVSTNATYNPAVYRSLGVNYGLVPLVPSSFIGGKLQLRGKSVIK